MSGVHYFNVSQRAEFVAPKSDLYFYKVLIGKQTIAVEYGDCVFWLSEDGNMAHLSRGPCEIESPLVATIVRGYMPETKSSSISGATTLPYINGCSTRQIFPPDRPGDPCLQLLQMPSYTSEQVHHIHSTARVVYTREGNGTSFVGMGEAMEGTALKPGDVVVLSPMCPHHFVTTTVPLTVIPLHIFSSVGASEFNHPMYNGTHKV